MTTKATGSAKHTPGPWQYLEGENDLPVIRAQKSRDKGYGVTVASVAVSPFPAAERKANARLIAAAPELLEAAQSLIAYLDREAQGEQSAQDIARQSLADLLRAAIAKATGQEVR